MSRLLTLTLTSHRGRRYPVELFTADTAFADEGAVYLLMRLPEGRAVQAQILYVGDAEALGAQLEADKRENGRGPAPPKWGSTRWVPWRCRAPRTGR